MFLTPKITVLGSGGWIGSAIANNLKRSGVDVTFINRSSFRSWLASAVPQEYVIFTIGLTSDFRIYPHATVESHVDVLSKVIQRPGIKNLLYLSSTRVYSRSSHTSESLPLAALSSDPSDLYNLSKMLGESLVLQDSRPGFKVVRLSNVVGLGQPTNTFLGSIIYDAKHTGAVTIQQPANFAKDYVSLDDVVRLLPEMAVKGKRRLYNLGSGTSTQHSQIAEILQHLGVTVRFASPSTSEQSFPSLNISRLLQEFTPPVPAPSQNLLNCLLTDESKV